ncbi:MAG TPA: GAF domain-containing protein [bacterium]
MIEKKEKFETILAKIKDVTAGNDSRDEKLNAVCQLLYGGLPYYNWVGFYLTDETGKNLMLGPYLGAPTEHVKIAFGQGICGQAAERKETFVVQDVSKETNYLSCSIKVKAEIVVPIFKGEKIAGELDIDSHTANPFTQEDKLYLEKICGELKKIF